MSFNFPAVSTNSITAGSGSVSSDPVNANDIVNKTYASKFVDGFLYVSGTFTRAGRTGANQIAEYNTKRWSAMGSSLNQGSNTVPSEMKADSSGNIYAAGSFTTIDGIAANRIAMWDGRAWHALGTGVADASVVTMGIDSNDNVYIGGTFTSVGGVANTRLVAKWEPNNNFGTWVSLGAGLNGGSFIEGLTIDSNDDVYVGGFFTDAAGVANTGRIAKWDGTAWSSITPNGIPNNIPRKMAVDSNDNLYVAGEFTSIDGVAATRAAFYNAGTTTWTAVGVGLGTGFTRTVTTDSLNNAYFGGQWTQLGDATTARRIAIWNGTTLSEFGGGLNADCRDIETDSNDNVYVVGDFTTVDVAGGGISVNYFAVWNGSSWSTIGEGFNGFPVYSIAINE